MSGTCTWFFQRRSRTFVGQSKAIKQGFHIKSALVKFKTENVACSLGPKIFPF